MPGPHHFRRVSPGPSPNASPTPSPTKSIISKYAGGSAFAAAAIAAATSPPPQPGVPLRRSVSTSSSSCCLSPKAFFDTPGYDGATTCDGRSSPFAGSQGSAMSNHSSGDSTSLRAPPDEQERARHELWLMQQQSPKLAFSRRQASFNGELNGELNGDLRRSPGRSDGGHSVGRSTHRSPLVRSSSAPPLGVDDDNVTAAFRTNWFGDGLDDDLGADDDLEEGAELVFMETSAGVASQRDEKRVLLDDPCRISGQNIALECQRHRKMQRGHGFYEACGLLATRGGDEAVAATATAFAGAPSTSTEAAPGAAASTALAPCETRVTTAAANGSSSTPPVLCSGPCNFVVTNPRSRLDMAIVNCLCCGYGHICQRHNFVSVGSSSRDPLLAPGGNVTCTECKASHLCFHEWVASTQAPSRPQAVDQMCVHCGLHRECPHERRQMQTDGTETCLDCGVMMQSTRSEAGVGNRSLQDQLLENQLRADPFQRGTFDGALRGGGDGAGPTNVPRNLQPAQRKTFHAQAALAVDAGRSAANPALCHEAVAAAAKQHEKRIQDREKWATSLGCELMRLCEDVPQAVKDDCETLTLQASKAYEAHLQHCSSASCQFKTVSSLSTRGAGTQLALHLWCELVQHQLEHDYCDNMQTSVQTGLRSRLKVHNQTRASTTGSKGGQMRGRSSNGELARRRAEELVKSMHNPELAWPACSDVDVSTLCLQSAARHCAQRLDAHESGACATLATSTNLTTSTAPPTSAVSTFVTPPSLPKQATKANTIEQAHMEELLKQMGNAALQHVLVGPASERGASALLARMLLGWRSLGAASRSSDEAQANINRDLLRKGLYTRAGLNNYGIAVAQYLAVRPAERCAEAELSKRYESAWSEMLDLFYDAVSATCAYWRAFRPADLDAMARSRTASSPGNLATQRIAYEQQPLVRQLAYRRAALFRQAAEQAAGQRHKIFMPYDEGDCVIMLRLAMCATTSTLLKECDGNLAKLHDVAASYAEGEHARPQLPLCGALRLDGPSGGAPRLGLPAPPSVA